MDAANRILVNGSTATLNELAVKLGETTELSLSEAALKESLQRWNSSVNKVCGMKHADPTMDAQALNKAMMKNAGSDPISEMMGQLVTFFLFPRS